MLVWLWRDLGWNSYRIAKRARDTHALVTILQDYSLPLYEASGQDPGDLNEFIGAGERFTGEVLLVAHGELPADAIDRRLANKWGKLAAKEVRFLGPEVRHEFGQRRRTVTL
jgi:hypothetical protein